MQDKYILPLILGIGVGVLLICVLLLLHKLFMNKKKNSGHNNTDKKQERKSNVSSRTSTPTIIPRNIPGFMVPAYRNVRVQEPLRKGGAFSTGDLSSEECEVELLKPRSNNNLPVSTVIQTKQSCADLRRVSLMQPISPLTVTDGKIYGSISLQDLNICLPKSRSRSPLAVDGPAPCLKFALYYSIGNTELNVTLLSLQNLAHVAANMSSVHLCVWVQVQFSKYHQEFRTSKCVAADETIFNETCVVSDFAAEHFTGSKISFRVIGDDSHVVAEAVYVVLGLPPSFPRNETIELQRPGIIQSSTSKNGELLLRLKYDPVEEAVTLGIVECRGLRSDKKKNKPLDTYVKVQVIFANETVQRFKSQLITKDNNPKYNKTLTLAGFFSRVKMTQTLVKVTVVVKSLQKYNLGFVMLGRSENVMTSGYQHWESIVDKPQLEIVQWHPLISSRSTTP